MSGGPGKYGSEAHEAMVATRGETVLLIVIGGHTGSGFSFVSRAKAPQLKAVPDMLESIAKQLRADLTAASGE